MNEMEVINQSSLNTNHNNYIVTYSYSSLGLTEDPFLARPSNFKAQSK